jgi:hypothetical protein
VSADLRSAAAHNQNWSTKLSISLKSFIFETLIAASHHHLPPQHVQLNGPKARFVFQQGQEYGDGRWFASRNGASSESTLSRLQSLHQ